MKKAFIFLALFFLVGQVFSGIAKTKTSTPLKPIGIKVYHFEIQGRTAPVAVWYPAEKPGESVFDYNQQVHGSAYLDAEPKRTGAPYPLIVFSHGMGGCGYQSVFYVENLVRAGYVVAAMDHKDSAMCAMDGKPSITTGQIVLATLKGGGNLSSTVMLLFRDKISNFDFSYRPKDISALIDRVLELNQTDPVLKGLIDTERIGATGHSLGGYTTLAIAGGVYDCVDPSRWSEDVCKQVDDMLARKDELKPGEFKLEFAQSACCLPDLKGKNISYADPRVDAALPLGPAIFFPERAFISVKMPVMIITGSGNFEVPFAPIQKVYNELAGPKYLLELKKVDHMTITDVAYEIGIARIVLPGFRSQYKMKKEIYENFSEKFFDAYLKGDQSALDYIKESHYPLVNLQAKP